MSPSRSGFFGVTRTDIGCMFILILGVAFVCVLAVAVECGDNKAICLANGYPEIRFANGWYCVKRTECQDVVVPVSELTVQR